MLRNQCLASKEKARSFRHGLFSEITLAALIVIYRQMTQIPP